jgi:hypothetical protein
VVFRIVVGMPAHHGKRGSSASSHLTSVFRCGPHAFRIDRVPGPEIRISDPRSTRSCNPPKEIGGLRAVPPLAARDRSEPRNHHPLWTRPRNRAQLDSGDLTVGCASCYRKLPVVLLMAGRSISHVAPLCAHCTDGAVFFNDPADGSNTEVSAGRLARPGLGQTWSHN